MGTLPGVGLDLQRAEYSVFLTMCAASPFISKSSFFGGAFLRDPADDMLLELAVTSESDLIVTYNVRHFVGVEQFGIRAVTPREFLEQIGVAR